MSNTKLKEEYWKRRQKVRSSLIKWGIKKGLVNDIDREHSVGVLEKIIKATQKRNPQNPVEYFLKGLNYSRIKHGRSSLSVSLKKTIQPQRFILCNNTLYYTGQAKSPSLPRREE